MSEPSKEFQRREIEAPGKTVGRMIDMLQMAQAESRTGEPAVALYLGRDEVMALDENLLAQAFRYTRFPIGRPELMGIPIFVVDAESHMACK